MNIQGALPLMSNCTGHFFLWLQLVLYTINKSTMQSPLSMGSEVIPPQTCQLCTLKMALDFSGHETYPLPRQKPLRSKANASFLSLFTPALPAPAANSCPVLGDSPLTELSFKILNSKGLR